MSAAKRVVSLNDLAHRIGIPRERLEDIAANIRAHYSEWSHTDSKGRIRILRSPRAELMSVQRRLVARLFSNLALGDNVHGGVRGRSTRTNASAHLGQPCVITLDVKQFYDRVRHSIVYRLFCKELGFGRDVARLLTRLTTYNDALPQGAPTSLAIANLVLTSPLDNPLSAEAKRIGVNASRFVDDIALSGSDPRSLINGVAKKLSRRRLPMYRKKAGVKAKLKIMPNSGPQEITGLLVNRSQGPSISRARRDKVRAAIHELPVLGVKERAFAVRSIEGRIHYVNQFNPGSGSRLKRLLLETLRIR